MAEVLKIDLRKIKNPEEYDIYLRQLKALKTASRKASAKNRAEKEKTEDLKVGALIRKKYSDFRALTGAKDICIEIERIWGATCFDDPN